VLITFLLPLPYAEKSAWFPEYMANNWKGLHRIDKDYMIFVKRFKTVAKKSMILMAYCTLKCKMLVVNPKSNCHEELSWFKAKDDAELIHAKLRLDRLTEFICSWSYLILPSEKITMQIILTWTRMPYVLNCFPRWKLFRFVGFYNWFQSFF
jgi:hypothetical protein